MSLFPPGSGGPTLPEFKSLLVKGPYHASAPVHLALSFTEKQPDMRIVMITPSRQAITRALREHNDDWMVEHSGRGEVLELSDCTMVYYPPTPAHFAYLISTLSTQVEGTDPKAVLYRPLSLIVLVELSAYFLRAGDKPWTLSSYMTLVARSLAAVAALSAEAESVLLFLGSFATHSYSLKLPVLKPPTADSNKPAPRKEPVALHVQQYFQLTAVVEEDDDVVLNSSQEDEGREVNRRQWNRLRILKEGSLVRCLRWSERRDPDTDGVVFTWDDYTTK
uniref:Uncharacterized protein n=1 Tax=Mycena chlorophos TaxID=658473 RepID=A0ABQ0LUK7_MYCCL|nr:predicted protein [Mycena chlorophos]